jgi:hypothetical protein
MWELDFNGNGKWDGCSVDRFAGDRLALSATFL